MTDILCFLYISFPYMLCYQLHMIFAFCAFRFLGTITANISTAFVFTIAISICCAIRKHLIFRANIAVVILIINVVMLSEIAFFWHRTEFLLKLLNFLNRFLQMLVAGNHFYLSMVFYLEPDGLARFLFFIHLHTKKLVHERLVSAFFYC